MNTCLMVSGFIYKKKFTENQFLFLYLNYSVPINVIFTFLFKVYNEIDDYT